MNEVAKLIETKKKTWLAVPFLFAAATLGLVIGFQGELQKKEAAFFKTQEKLNQKTNLVLQTLENKISRVRNSAMETVADLERPIQSSEIVHLVAFETSGKNVIRVLQNKKNSQFYEENNQASAHRTFVTLKNWMQSKHFKPHGPKTQWLEIPQTDSQGPTFGLVIQSKIQNTDSHAVVLALLKPQFFDSTMKAISRAYLVSGSGKLIHHFQKNLIGRSLVNSPFFKDQLSSLFGGIETSGSSDLISFDQKKVLAGFSQVMGLPLVLVVEASYPKVPSAPTDTWIPIGLMSFGAFLFLFSVIGIFKKRKRKKIELKEEPKEEENKNKEENIALTPEITPAMEVPGFAKQSSGYGKDDFSGILNANTPSVGMIVSQFQSMATRIRDPHLIFNMLCESTAQLCESPALYFSFEEKSGEAGLTTDSGFEAHESPTYLNFSIDSKTQEEILNLAQKGRVASLAHYGPLANLLLKKLGVAHFEAWSLTSYLDPRKNQITRPRLLGILVVVQAGLQSSASRDALMSMMRTTGIVFEQNNQTQPMQNPPQEQKPTLQL
tara:strand:- start:2473 stop:4125 length:1653 start_codon:yes stop_codon:yes gene_type:complete